MDRARSLILGIDAGTTGVTVILYDPDLHPVKRAYSEFAQHYPHPGWVEHDADEIRDVTIRLVREVVREAAAKVAAVGITNQRETVVPLDVASGKPLGRAIVWQCRRTTERCAELKAAGHEGVVRKKTGLLLDPYFSGTKMRWLLDENPDVARAAGEGRLRFCTIDAFLVHALTGGRVVATDPTNASRTLVYDIDARTWDPELLGILGVEAASLPEVRPSAGDFGTTDPTVVGFEAPIAGVAGDQQSALFGQGCFDGGTAKNTYGTGCFLLVNAGDARPVAPDGILTTVACGRSGEATYALEGSVFIAGAAIQWLRDELGLVGDVSESEALARSIDDTDGVYLVPAFTGLGAPWWDPDARGVLCGLTRGTGRAQVVRAALESIAYQTHDLFKLLREACGHGIDELRVDGGATRNRWLMEFQAGILGTPVAPSSDLETTCRGAALLAAVGAGLISDPREARALEEGRTRFDPGLDADVRRRLLLGWDAAIARTRSK
ncbi:MAG: glycerol kinase [Planctomycetes bacterium]|nr:glycerol kinase [Planctomycetota bacterium]